MAEPISLGGQPNGEENNSGTLSTNTRYSKRTHKAPIGVNKVEISMWVMVVKTILCHHACNSSC